MVVDRRPDDDRSEDSAPGSATGRAPGWSAAFAPAPARLSRGSSSIRVCTWRVQTCAMRERPESRSGAPSPARHACLAIVTHGPKSASAFISIHTKARRGARPCRQEGTSWRGGFGEPPARRQAHASRQGSSWRSRRRLYRLTGPTRLRLVGLVARLTCGLLGHCCLGGIVAAACDLAARFRLSGDPVLPSSPLLRCSEAVTPLCRSRAGSPQASTLLSPPAEDLHRCRGLQGSHRRRSAACAPLPTACLDGQPPLIQRRGAGAERVVIGRGDIGESCNGRRLVPRAATSSLASTRSTVANPSVKVL